MKPAELDPKLQVPDVEAASPGAALPHGAKKVALFFLKYVVGISLIVWMVATGKVDLSVLGSLPGSLLSQALALTFVFTLLGAVRVRYILQKQAIHTGVWQCFLYNCAGILYSAFLPGGISGDAVRAYLFMKAVPDRRLAILGAMVLDRVLGLVSMVFLGLVAACYMAINVPFIRPYLLGFAAVFFTLIGGVALLHFIGGRHTLKATATEGLVERIWARLASVIASLRIHEYPARALTFVVLQSMVIHLLAVALIYICSVYAGSGLDFLRVFVATPIGLLVNAIPLSPGGLGIGENAFELLYKTIGGRNGATSFLLARVFLYSPALIGLAYVLKRMVTRRSK
ncbi:MAG TPA: lysylphosphatidylglycerol synthase transmembrane domain-containing protein [Usitatibacter sp.]|nr:lysylphosphatidylglycerol synthase transmembrane domain-containing protein [Usitatibacter sp.]